MALERKRSRQYIASEITRRERQQESINKQITESIKETAKLRKARGVNKKILEKYKRDLIAYDAKSLRSGSKSPKMPNRYHDPIPTSVTAAQFRMMYVLEKTGRITLARLRDIQLPWMKQIQETLNPLEVKQWVAVSGPKGRFKAKLTEYGALALAFGRANGLKQSPGPNVGNNSALVKDIEKLIDERLDEMEKE